jgi:hypothetical protein
MQMKRLAYNVGQKETVYMMKNGWYKRGNTQGGQSSTDSRINISDAGRLVKLCVPGVAVCARLSVRLCDTLKALRLAQMSSLRANM